MLFASFARRTLRFLAAGLGAATLAALPLAAAAAEAAPERPALHLAVPHARIAPEVDDADRVQLPSQRHPRLARAQDLGRVADTLRLERMVLTLAPDAAQEQALERYLQQVQDPASPLYHRWLTPAEFEAQFGAAEADVAVITKWLRRHGLQVDDVPTGRRSIVFSGTAAQVQSAFGTEIRRYRVDGEEHVANAAAPQIPDALSAAVSGVLSLHDFRRRPMRGNARPAPGYTGSSGTHALAPADYGTVYNLKSQAAQGVTGSGRSIAVLGRTSVLTSDITLFRSTMGLPANPPQIVVNGATPSRVSGDEGESDLDLEWAGAVAPLATVKFVTSKSTTTTDGIDLSAQYAVANNVADVITLSYGACEADLGSTDTNFYNSLWQQAAAQGISVFVSSGDSGAAGCDSGNASTGTAKGVNGLCSSPYSTCVGGTQFADTASPASYWSASNGSDLGSALSYIPEVAWNESGTVSGGSGLWSTGGGASIYFAKPAWQTGVNVPADGKRDVPDVSLTAASHDGYLVYSSEGASSPTLYIFGGTSASAPSMAGIMALVNHKTGARQGHANPRLYQLSAAQASGGPAVFHLITSGNNSVPGVTGFAASSGAPYFNLATGLGSVDGGQLLANWAANVATTSTALSTSTGSSTYGQNVVLTATVSGSSPTGSVQFKDGSTDLGSAVPLSGGVATLSTPDLAVGSHALTAVYGGDSANGSSVSPAATVTVAQATPALSLSSSSSTSVFGSSVSFTATLTGARVSGRVQFFDGSTLLGQVALADCAVVLTTSSLGVGTHAITAVYSGDAGNAAAASAAVVQTVTPMRSATTTTLGASATAITAGQGLTLTAKVSGNAATGTVQFRDGSAALGAPAALSGGTAVLSVNTLGAGNHTLTAVYGGDAANLGSTSGSTVVSVAPAAATVSVASSKASSTAGESVTFTATVTGFNPGGTVQFLDGTAVLGSSTLAADGSASFATAALTVGTHAISARYAGDVNNTAATSAALTQTVLSATAGDGDVPLPGWALALLAAVLGAPFLRRRVQRPGAMAGLALAVGVAAALSATPAHADVLAGWDMHSQPGGQNAFGASPLAATTSDTHLTVGGLTRGSGVGTTGTAAARGWGGTTWSSTTAADAVANNRSVIFSATAQAGYQVSYSAISRFDYRRSSTGPTTGVVQYQVGSGAFADIATVSYSSTASGGASLSAIDLSGIAALQNVPAGTAVTFRIVNFGASSSGGTWYLFDTANTTASDFEVSGSVSVSGPVDGACGSSNGQMLTAAPATGLCTAGTPSAVSGSGPWSWSCTGLNGGSTASCTADKRVVLSCPAN